MKNTFIFALPLLFVLPVAAQVSNPKTSSPVRPRVVEGQNPSIAQATPQPTVTPTPESSKPKVVIVPSASPGFPTSTPSPRPTATPLPSPSPSPATVTPPVSAGSTVINPLPPVLPKAMLNYGQIKARLTEAKRLLQARPSAIAMVDDKNNLLNSAVTLALHDPRTNAIDTVTLAKETFLTLNQESFLFTASGKQIRLRTIRANGVNTAVTVVDQSSQPLVPLLVQYPVERGGKFYEMAYYVSAHPALTSKETALAGQLYIRTTLETALKNLRARGKFISPAVIAEAEKLCIVEHVDHQRFRNENRAALYDEIFTLFALNEGQTYRYAVSTAGAGGLVQMIPSTYRMVRAMHPTIPLMPDFVEGMRNHNNAMQAMLLYMQDTYNDLIANQTIANALDSGIATDAELMAAGYNSNPARLHLYVRRGGANWRNLIPRETQMYLQIQKSVETTIKPLPPVK
jgi:hypothetical protein